MPRSTRANRAFRMRSALSPGSWVITEATSEASDSSVIWDMSEITEESLASLVASVITHDPGDSADLILKALFALVERGMAAEQASRRVEDVLRYLELIL